MFIYFKMVLQKMLVAILAIALVNSVADATDTTNSCPESFHGKCQCGEMFSRYDNFKTKKFTVNCTNTGFTTADMLHDLPEETEVLVFTGNYVQELPANVLDNLKDYPDLETIDMSNNNIRFIQGKTFHKVYNVKTLILDHNDLDITEDRKRPRIFSNFEDLERLHLTNAFTEKVNASNYLLSLEDIFYESELIYLKVLHLEQNEIWSIGKNPKVFCQLPDLEQIHLGDNRLIDFDFQIDCLTSLRYIDLERNMIARLSDEAMKRLDQFSNKKGDILQLNLVNNPFSCDSRSQNFMRWLNTTRIDIRRKHDYECVDGYPERNVGKKLMEVQPMKCTSGDCHDHDSHDHDFHDHDFHDHDLHDHAGHHDDHHTVGYSSATIGALSFLLVFTSSLLLAVAYYQREKLKFLATPLWTFVTKNIGYTGIASEEAPREVNV